MRILPIVSNNYSGNAFKGLCKYEESQYGNGWATTGYDEENKYIYYYPFEDETQEEIDKFMRLHPDTSEVVEYYKTGDKPPELVTLGCIKNCYTKLKNKLPFTKKEYENYSKKIMEDILSYNKVEEALIKLGL